MSGDHNMYCSANNPIAWMSPDGKVSQTEGKLFHSPLYAAPKKRCEPICKPSVCDCIKNKPLSNEEIRKVWLSLPYDPDNAPYIFARLIEERHGIK